MNRSARFTTFADPASETIQHRPPGTYTCTIGIDPINAIGGHPWRRQFRSALGEIETAAQAG
jgi:hypothetical protein